MFTDTNRKPQMGRTCTGFWCHKVAGYAYACTMLKPNKSCFQMQPFATMSGHGVMDTMKEEWPACW